MTGQGPRIGIVGTFDVANFGDLLFPLLAQRALEDRLPGAVVQPYSFRSMSASDWVYEVRCIDELRHDVGHLDGLLVGGGYLIRFDKDVAEGYVSTSSQVHHPTGYWLAPTLWAAQHGVPTIWNAVGVAPTVPRWGSRLLERVLPLPDVVVAREQPSFRQLARHSPHRDVHLRPDTAMDVQDLEHADPMEQRRQRLLQELQITRPYVIVQASARLRKHVERIQTALEKLHAEGFDVVELPISLPQLDGSDALPLTGPTVRPHRWIEPLEVIALVSRAAAVLPYSYHLSITAMTAGVPIHRFPEAADSKYESLTDLGTVHRFTDSTDLAAQILESIRRPAALNPKIREARAQVRGHWDEAVTLFSGGVRRPVTGSRRTSDFLASLPELFEDQEQQHQSDLDAVHKQAARSAEERAAALTHLGSSRQEVARLADELRHGAHERADLAKMVEAGQQALQARLRELSEERVSKGQFQELHDLFEETVGAREEYRQAASQRASRITELLQEKEGLQQSIRAHKRTLQAQTNDLQAQKRKLRAQKQTLEAQKRKLRLHKRKLLELEPQLEKAEKERDQHRSGARRGRRIEREYWKFQAVVEEQKGQLRTAAQHSRKLQAELVEQRRALERLEGLSQRRSVRLAVRLAEPKRLMLRALRRPRDGDGQ